METYLLYIIIGVFAIQFFLAGMLFQSEYYDSENNKLMVIFLTIIAIFFGVVILLGLLFYYKVILKVFKLLDDHLLISFQVEYVWFGKKHTTSQEVLDLLINNRKKLLSEERKLTIREKRHISATNWVEKNTTVLEPEY